MLIVAALTCLLAASFWWTGRWMVTRWEQPGSYYSHGWLIPPIALGLLYVRRKRLAAIPCSPFAPGVLILAASLLVHLVATAWRVGFLSGFALLGVVSGLVLTLCGTEAFRTALFPIAFLAFMVPVPEVFIDRASFGLKLLAAAVATGAVEVFGLAAVREGSYIQIASGTVVVDDVCSGLKYLIALTAFGALYASMSALRGWLKWALFALAVPIAFVANVIRVTLMVVVADQWGIEASTKWYSHDLFGFALFAVAFGMLFLCESLLLGGARRQPKPLEAPAEAGPALERGPLRIARRPRALPAAVLSLLAIAGVASTYLAWPRAAANSTETLRSIPLTLGGWTGADQVMADRVYEILGTRDVLSRRYRNERDEQVVLVVVLAQQLRRRTHPPEQCFQGEGYIIRQASVRQVDVPVAGGTRRLPIRELILEHRAGNRIAWYFYKSGPRLSASYWRHQLGVALHKVADPDAADILVRVDARIPEGGVEDGRRLLLRFLSSAADQLLTRLP